MINNNNNAYFNPNNGMAGTGVSMSMGMQTQPGQMGVSIGMGMQPGQPMMQMQTPGVSVQFPGMGMQTQTGQPMGMYQQQPQGMPIQAGQPMGMFQQPQSQPQYQQQQYQQQYQTAGFPTTSVNLQPGFGISMNTMGMTASTVTRSEFTSAESDKILERITEAWQNQQVSVLKENVVNSGKVLSVEYCGKVIEAVWKDNQSDAALFLVQHHSGSDADFKSILRQKMWADEFIKAFP